jgi:lipopolysaccharide export system protein LptA
VKRKLLILTAAGWVIAMSPLAQTPLANAQNAAATPSPAVETAPPTGEVSAPTGAVLPPAANAVSAPSPLNNAAPPGASTISAPSASTSQTAPAAVLAAPEASTPSVTTGKKKAASVTGKDKDNAADSSPFGGFESSSNHGPINIKSETMQFDYKNNVVVFSGHVHADQSGSELTSNTLNVQMNKQSQIQQMIADGNVRMSQGQRWATGDHAVLDENVHTLVLTGSPVVHDGKDQIAGTKITVHLQTNISEVTDPKAVIFPHEAKTPNNSGTATDPAP